MGNSDRRHDRYDEDHTDFEELIANRFDEDAAIERAEARYERYVYGD
ncbi:hypothetical protein [Mycolicibacterium aubagnense]|nr:hypothetical protein [Mycolicibacterium aubagnense]